MHWFLHTLLLYFPQAEIKAKIRVKHISIITGQHLFSKLSFEGHVENEMFYTFILTVYLLEIMTCYFPSHK